MQTKGGVKKNNYFYIAIVLLLIAFLIFSSLFFYFILNSKTIAKGVFVNGISLGGLTKEEAVSLLQKELKAPSDFSLTLKYQDKVYRLTAKDINLAYDYQEIVDKAYKIGREGNPFERIREIYLTDKHGKYFNFYPAYDENKINEFIDKISKEIERNPVDAKIKITRGIRQITEDIEGIKVDKNKTLQQLKEVLNDMVEGKIGDAEVHIAVDRVKAKITKTMLEMIKDKISTFSTIFNPQDVNRSENLAVAAKAVDGTLLMPGEIFSLNKTLGPRIIENGYKQAPVIIGNKLVPAIGGGVCQVATTLYNAALRADVKITERYHHTFPVGYVPPGQDATISGDVLDLKFENSSPYPMYIEAYISGNQFVVNIYGYAKDPSRRIEIHSEIVEKYEPKITYIDDPTLPEGEQVVNVEQHTGYKVNTYRLIYVNNVLVKKELLYTDVYKPVDGIIKRGTKKVNNLKPQETFKKKEENKNSPQDNPDTSQDTLIEDLTGEPQTINPSYK